MATIDDYGNTTDPLSAPPLGGPGGWAEAVAAAIHANAGEITRIEGLIAAGGGGGGVRAPAAGCRR